MYKPGQDVMFRVVTVYPDLKPYKASLNIYIRVSIHRNLAIQCNLSYIPALCDKERLYVLLPKSCYLALHLTCSLTFLLGPSEEIDSAVVDGGG